LLGCPDYSFSDRILPPDGGLTIRLQKILMDQTIYLTVKCSMYISAVGLLNGDNWETITNNVKSRIGNIVFTAWKFWPLVHCVTYGVIPARHRILWVNSVDLIWNAILATLARKVDPVDESPTADDDAEGGELLLSAEGEHEQPVSVEKFSIHVDEMPSAMQTAAPAIGGSDDGFIAPSAAMSVTAGNSHNATVATTVAV
jgi:Mpv17 / PMP22 family